MSDDVRLRFLLKAGAPDGFTGIDKDRYEFAYEVAKERGHEEPDEQDELDGFRRMIDAAIKQEAGAR